MTRSNHPKKIKIGPYDYTVKEYPKDEENNYGACVYRHQEIYISRNQNAQRAADTLLHEVMHAIWDAAGLEAVPDLHEEVVVRMMSTWLTGVLNDNKAFREFITNPEATWVPQYESDPLKDATE